MNIKAAVQLFKHFHCVLCVAVLGIKLKGVNNVWVQLNTFCEKETCIPKSTESMKLPFLLFLNSHCISNLVITIEGIFNILNESYSLDYDVLKVLFIFTRYCQMHDQDLQHKGHLGADCPRKVTVSFPMEHTDFL